MVELLNCGEADAAVTMHYSFPVGVATVGRVITPARGRPMFIATTTGTASTDRVQAMVKNAIYGIATAKALGITRPTVGILNLDGARQVECRLKQMAARGYRINFGTSVRADGGCIMRGNDLITGPVDVMITDSLTGNVVMKVLSAFTSGGDYETTGSGYGPGAGPGFDKIICIISRASGAPVVANALKYATQATLGNLVGVVGQEIESAIRAGFDGFGAGEAICPEVEELKAGVAREVALQAKQDREDVGSGTRRPPAKVVTEEIPGIDILELEDAADLLADKGIFAATGMGCTGPVILVAPEDIEQAITALKEGGYLQ
jgi:betaine reductase